MRPSLFILDRSRPAAPMEYVPYSVQRAGCQASPQKLPTSSTKPAERTMPARGAKSKLPHSCSQPAPEDDDRPCLQPKWRKASLPKAHCGRSTTPLRVMSSPYSLRRQSATDDTVRSVTPIPRSLNCSSISLLPRKPNVV